MDFLQLIQMLLSGGFGQGGFAQSGMGGGPQAPLTQGGDPGYKAPPSLAIPPVGGLVQGGVPGLMGQPQQNPGVSRGGDGGMGAWLNAMGQRPGSGIGGPAPPAQAAPRANPRLRSQASVDHYS